MRCFRLLPFALFALTASSIAQSTLPLFAPAVPYGFSGFASDSVAVVDVNADGKPDLVVTNRLNDYSSTNGTVDVLLGNGDGTFQHPVTYSSGGNLATSVVVADVNGDGKADLIVSNNNGIGTVGVLLGNGNGTFQPPMTYGSGGYGAFRIAVADVNEDGKPDVVVPHQCGDIGCTYGSVGVLLGSGDGNFLPAFAYPSGGVDALSVAVVDVNGDGKRDIVVVNFASSGIGQNGENGTVAVLLGNGDGTFQTAMAYGSGAYGANSVAVADMNGDGKPDVVVAHEYGCFTGCINGILGVLLGNGDGTFQQVVTYNSGGGWAMWVATADVNGDDNPDLVVANLVQSTVSVLLGNGHGTFQPAVTFNSGGGTASAVAIADLNGDGRPDVLVANECTTRDNCNNGSVSVLINITPPPYKAVVQPPVNADGSSIFKANRGVIPVKFALTKSDAPTCDLSSATIAVTRTAGGVLGSIDEATYSMAADNGSNFRIDPTSCQYIYNLAASALGVGTYRVDISINGIMVGHALFALK